MQQWSSAAEFLAMGGHGLYVWGSYAVTAVALCAEIWLVARRHREARQAIRLHEGTGDGD